MQAKELITLMDALSNLLDPVTGKSFPANSCLKAPSIKQAINEVKIAAQQIERPISDVAVLATCQKLRELSFTPTAPQLVKVYLGSKTVVAPDLRGLPEYGSLKGLISKRAALSWLKAFAARHPNQIRANNPTFKRIQHQPWQTVPYFKETPFNQLSPDLINNFRQNIAALGLQKATQQLPSSMARTRQQLPRAFEPWTKEEKAILVEVMCYTNQIALIAPIFGRSTRAILSEGKKLIYLSAQQHKTS